MRSSVADVAEEREHARAVDQLAGVVGVVRAHPRARGHSGPDHDRRTTRSRTSRHPTDSGCCPRARSTSFGAVGSVSGRPTAMATSHGPGGTPAKRTSTGPEMSTVPSARDRERRIPGPDRVAPEQESASCDRANHGHERAQLEPELPARVDAHLGPERALRRAGHGEGRHGRRLEVHAKPHQTHRDGRRPGHEHEGDLVPTQAFAVDGAPFVPRR